MSLAEFLDAVPALLGVIGAALGCLVFVVKKNDSLSREMRTEIALAATAEGKARGELAALIEKEIATHGTSLQRIERESARKEELQSLESRVGSKLDRHETKIDRINEQIGLIAVVEQMCRSNGEDIRRVLARLERKPATSD